MDSSDEEYFTSPSVINAIINWKEFGKHPNTLQRNEFDEFYHLHNDLRKYPAKFQQYYRMKIMWFISIFL